MLNDICPQGNNAMCEVNRPSSPQIPDRYSRNEREDMQKAIECLYEFREKLDKLHPNCVRLMDGMLKANRY